MNFTKCKQGRQVQGNQLMLNKPNLGNMEPLQHETINQLVIVQCNSSSNYRQRLSQQYLVEFISMFMLSLYCYNMPNGANE